MLLSHSVKLAFNEINHGGVHGIDNLFSVARPFVSLFALSGLALRRSSYFAGHLGHPEMASYRDVAAILINSRGEMLLAAGRKSI